MNNTPYFFMKFQNLYESNLDIDSTYERLKKSPLIKKANISEGGTHHQGCGLLEVEIKGFSNKIIISRKGKIGIPFSDAKEKKLMMDTLAPLLITKDGSVATLTPTKTIVTVEWKNGIPPKNFQFPACARSFVYEISDVRNDDELALLEDIIKLSGLPENKSMATLQPKLELPMHLKKLLEQSRARKTGALDENNSPYRFC
jgi:hypothetical protein